MRIQARITRIVRLMDELPANCLPVVEAILDELEHIRAVINLLDANLSQKDAIELLDNLDPEKK